MLHFINLTSHKYFLPALINTVFFPWRCVPTRVIAFSFLRFLDHTTTHYSR